MLKKIATAIRSVELLSLLVFLFFLVRGGLHDILSWIGHVPFWVLATWAISGMVILLMELILLLRESDHDRN